MQLSLVKSLLVAGIIGLAIQTATAQTGPVSVNPVPAPISAPMQTPGSDVGLNDQTLEQMLISLGYTPMKNGGRYEVVVQADRLRIRVEVCLSIDKSNLWMMAWSNQVENINNVPAHMLVGLLQDNGNAFGNMFWKYDPTNKDINLTCVLENRGVTPVKLGATLSKLARNIETHYPRLNEIVYHGKNVVPGTADELAKLKGVWRVTEMNVSGVASSPEQVAIANCVVTINGNNMIVSTNPNRFLIWIDPVQKHLNFYNVQNGGYDLCLYQLEGNTLIVRFGAVGGQRPTDLNSPVLPGQVQWKLVLSYSGRPLL